MSAETAEPSRGPATSACTLSREVAPRYCPQGPSGSARPRVAGHACRLPNSAGRRLPRMASAVTSGLRPAAGGKVVLSLQLGACASGDHGYGGRQALERVSAGWRLLYLLWPRLAARGDTSRPRPPRDSGRRDRYRAPLLRVRGLPRRKGRPHRRRVPLVSSCAACARDAAPPCRTRPVKTIMAEGRDRQWQLRNGIRYGSGYPGVCASTAVSGGCVVAPWLP